MAIYEHHPTAVIEADLVAACLTEHSEDMPAGGTYLGAGGQGLAVLTWKCCIPSILGLDLRQTAKTARLSDLYTGSSTPGRRCMS